MKKKGKPKNKLENLSTHFFINYGQIEQNGEDCFFCSYNDVLSVLAVCDGCGGSGSTKYPNYDNKTGAYLASRIVTGALKKWFVRTCDNDIDINNIELDKLKDCIDGELHKYFENAQPTVKIKGSLTKPFPTTLATAIVSVSGNSLFLKSVWVGDSRVYIIDKKGLAQLSVDDVSGEDALSNLTGDGILTNVISANGNYDIHEASNTLNYPCVIFTATDGCFGYIPTPMQFEYMLLYSLSEAESVIQWKENIQKILCDVSGDDFTLCLSAWGFDNFDKMKTYFSDRLKFLSEKYIEPLDDADDKIKIDLWNEYQNDYYRFCEKNGGLL